MKLALYAERFGAQGITIHPRPDERHITTEDVYALKEAVTAEFNMEGYPDERFMRMVKEVKPDPPDVLTRNAGWDTLKQASLLSEVLSELKKEGIRTSIFVEPREKIIEGAAKIGADRIELYTEMYATGYLSEPATAITPYALSAQRAQSLGLGINAGHDLDLNNLAFLKKEIPYLDEVSIGHALICDALYLGLENTIQLYLRALR